MSLDTGGLQISLINFMAEYPVIREKALSHLRFYVFSSVITTSHMWLLNEHLRWEKYESRRTNSTIRKLEWLVQFTCFCWQCCSRTWNCSFDLRSVWCQRHQDHRMVDLEGTSELIQASSSQIVLGILPLTVFKSMDFLVFITLTDSSACVDCLAHNWCQSIALLRKSHFINSAYKSKKLSMFLGVGPSALKGRVAPDFGLYREQQSKKSWF